MQISVCGSHAYTHTHARTHTHTHTHCVTDTHLGEPERVHHTHTHTRTHTYTHTHAHTHHPQKHAVQWATHGHHRDTFAMAAFVASRRLPHDAHKAEERDAFSDVPSMNGAELAQQVQNVLICARENFQSVPQSQPSTQQYFGSTPKAFEMC